MNIPSNGRKESAPFLCISYNGFHVLGETFGLRSEERKLIVGGEEVNRLVCRRGESMNMGRGGDSS